MDIMIVVEWMMQSTPYCVHVLQGLDKGTVMGHEFVGHVHKIGKWGSSCLDDTA